ncbi:DUF1564 domain-containing protein [Leptospira noguchii]|uniref:DUF1564 domain-containing protein n=1 Tax=Leptospira noguchii TaxID=28182 RepID=UPI00024889A9|nr:DUF1564 domain-containing protein [Leptospira noguchii]EKR71748.1 PF07600 family protein [Leptospira noguchii str. 2006001870]TQE65485.1 DUF1564 domain-containing protein [Leptospira noguchii]UOG52890.1 DUF1564 domain-containing protein [Leptospira noguchii]UOG60833.1 DUF1564 domain-containing protein [Leptospira noguchii]
MEQIYFNTDQKIESTLNENVEKVVTLLVPKRYYVILSSKDRRMLGKKLPYLLNRYGKFISSHSRLNRRAVTTLYQKNQGELKKINFRIDMSHWAMLGVLAHAHGVSRCFLFNFLLSLEKAGVGDSIVKVLNEGVPTFHKIYRYIWQLDLSNKRISRTLRYFPNPLKANFKKLRT